MMHRVPLADLAHIERGVNPLRLARLREDIEAQALPIVLLARPGKPMLLQDGGHHPYLARERNDHDIAASFRCPECAGIGQAAPRVVCPECGGSGQAVIDGEIG